MNNLRRTLVDHLKDGFGLYLLQLDSFADAGLDYFEAVEMDAGIAPDEVSKLMFFLEETKQTVKALFEDIA